MEEHEDNMKDLGKSVVDSILGDSHEDEVRDLVPATSDLNDVSDRKLAMTSIAPDFDFQETAVKTYNTAKNMMTSLLKLYFEANIIEKNDYIKAKNEIETMKLHQLLQQLKYNDRAIYKLMDLIETGTIAPRLFEVLGTLQMVQLNIQKQLSVELMTNEESARRTALTTSFAKVNGEEASDERMQSTDGGFTGRGQKDLMRTLQEEEEAEQAEFEEIEEGNDDE